MSDDQVSAIARLAAELTPVREMAALLGIDEDALRLELSDRSPAARAVYCRARAGTATRPRRQELEFARLGSPLAVQLTGEYLREMTSDEDF